MNKGKEIKNQIPEKPLVLIKEECFIALVDVINQSGLPAFIIKPMLQELLNRTQSAMKTEYETTLKWYNEQCNLNANK